MKPLKKTVITASVLFILDAFVMNQGSIAMILILLVLFVFLPRALWARKDKTLSNARAARALIYLSAAIAVFVANTLQNQLADRRAIALGKACIAYHAKYGQYPEWLDNLVPEFVPAVPLAKYTLMSGHFSYFRSEADKEPMLYYQALPPYGRRFYHLERGNWGYLD